MPTKSSGTGSSAQQKQSSSYSSLTDEAIRCPKCLQKAEILLEQAREQIDQAVRKRSTPDHVPEAAWDVMVHRIQSARERHSAILRVKCFCSEEDTKP